MERTVEENGDVHLTMRGISEGEAVRAAVRGYLEALAAEGDSIDLAIMPGYRLVKA